MLRAGPERGGEPAVAREGSDDIAVSRAREESEGPVEVGLPGAVRAGDDVEAVQGEHGVADGPVSGDGERLEHGSMVPVASDMWTVAGVLWRTSVGRAPACVMVVETKDRRSLSRANETVEGSHDETSSAGV